MNRLWMVFLLGFLGLKSTATKADSFIQVTLKDSETVYYLEKDILEIAAVLPAQTIVQVPDGASPVNYDYRAANGSIERSSNGFFQGVLISSVPSSSNSDFTPERIQTLNKTPGGLYIGTSILSYGDVPVIDPLVAQKPTEDFLKNYDENGRPKFIFTHWYAKRFGQKLNLAINPNDLSGYLRIKWSQIYRALLQVADRTVQTSANLLFMDPAAAWQASIDYEKTGKTLSYGAWTIAVKSTAVRNEFPNVPCAEFMSEIIRQAYVRAGYSATEDFNAAAGNPLIWTQTAAVQGLGMALFKGGWIPWDSAYYKPKTGAIMLNAEGLSPGHAYLVAGQEGRFIVDNGSPRGRDLRVTRDKIIKMMYQNGVFFLPPSITPEAW